MAVTHFMSRVSCADSVQATVFFLASGSAKSITGVNIPVDQVFCQLAVDPRLLHAITHVTFMITSLGNHEATLSAAMCRRHVPCT